MVKGKNEQSFWKIWVIYFCKVLTGLPSYLPQSFDSLPFITVFFHSDTPICFTELESNHGLVMEKIPENRSFSENMNLTDKYSSNTYLRFIFFAEQGKKEEGKHEN